MERPGEAFRAPGFSEPCDALLEQRHRLCDVLLNLCHAPQTTLRPGDAIVTAQAPSSMQGFLVQRGSLYNVALMVVRPCLTIARIVGKICLRDMFVRPNLSPIVASYPRWP